MEERANFLKIAAVKGAFAQEILINAGAGCHFDTSASQVKISEDGWAIWCFMGLGFLQMENT